ncbi:MAG: hypothetical protein HZA20_13680 [Nitrospirae bacterium]|nr:hypothetical protein [Nitrospirota bacterium]
MDDDAKIYNVCLQRVKFQIENAIKRLNASLASSASSASLANSANSAHSGRITLESYQTDDIEEIVDILELYDLEDRTEAGLKEKLDDLAYTVSVLVRETVAFDYDDRGSMALFLVVNQDEAVLA